MKKYLLLLYIINASAQNNPGFIGKKNVFGVNFSSHPMMKLETKSNSKSFAFTLEHSLTRKASIELGYGFYKSTVNEKLIDNIDNTNKGYRLIYYDYTNGTNTYLRFMGTGQVKYNVGSISLKRYLRGFGAIAPRGLFFSLDFYLHNWSHSNTSYTGYFKDQFGKDQYLTPADKPKSIFMTEVGLSVGNRRILAYGFSLMWKISSGIPIMSNLPVSMRDSYFFYQNANDFANVNIAETALRRRLLELTLGLGYHF